MRPIPRSLPFPALCALCACGKTIEYSSALLVTVRSDVSVDCIVLTAGNPDWTMSNQGSFVMSKVNWIEFHSNPTADASTTGEAVAYYDAVKFY